MPRVTAEEVATLLPDVTTSMVTTLDITQATVLTDRVVTCASSKGITLSDDEAKMIELNLAAHFFTRRDQQYQSKSTGDASASFQGQTGLGLDSSFFGQTAKTFDRSSCLAHMDKQQKFKAGGFWAGKAPIPSYRERHGGS